MAPSAASTARGRAWWSPPPGRRWRGTGWRASSPRLSSSAPSSGPGATSGSSRPLARSVGAGRRSRGSAWMRCGAVRPAASVNLPRACRCSCPPPCMTTTGTSSGSSTSGAAAGGGSGWTPPCCSSARAARSWARSTSTISAGRLEEAPARLSRTPGIGWMSRRHAARTRSRSACGASPSSTLRSSLCCSSSRPTPRTSPAW
mmetsp:Transcript_134404/g.374601  ORF Transcript_134404/g.374601 Transcript_134404/m.374601 type:complete len:202 (+) Transcript_134404:826-1431(+)